MPFQNRIQTNFARGEVAPDVQFRPELEITQAALALCRNFIPKFQGGLSYAPGSTFITAASVIAGSILIPFVYRDTQAFQFELYVDSSDDLNIRILKDEGVLLFSKGNIGWVRNSDRGVFCTFDFTGGASEDIIIRTDHLLSDNDIIFFTETAPGDLPAEIEANRKYFVINSATNNFQIAKTLGGSVLEFTDDGSTGAKYNLVSDTISDSEQIGFPAGVGNDPSNIATATSDTGTECTFDYTGGADENIIKDVAHGLSDDTEIYFTNSGGALPAELVSFKSYYVINKEDDYFQIAKTVGGDIIEFSDDGTVTSKYHQYTYAEEVNITITGTFSASDLNNVKFAQSGAAMVIISEGQFCIQVWRGATTETTWAINKASVVSSVFTSITAIADDGNGNAKYTVTPHEYAVGDIAIIKRTSADNDYDSAEKVTIIVDANNFVTNQEFIGDTLSSSEVTRKGGNFHNFVFCFEEVTDFMTDVDDIPKEVKFNEGRLYFTLDDKMYGSRSVVDGQDMYTNFNQSITAIATDAIEFTASISSDKVDLFNWLKVSNKAFYAGMENLIASIEGNTFDEPIAGDSIRMQSLEDRGSTDVAPIEDGKDIIFVGSTGKKINSFTFDLRSDSERSNDLSILDEHMFTSTVKRIVFQRGLPDIVWVLLSDGNLLGFIFNSNENITGWFKYIDGQDDIYKDISVSPVSNGVDRLWVVIARSNGSTGTEDQIEQLNIPVQFLKFEDFYSSDGKVDETEDLRRWKNATYEQQKHAVHMHSMLKADVFDTTEDASTYLHFSSDLSTIFTSSDGTAVNKITGASSPLNGEDGNNVVVKATIAGLGEGIYEIGDYTSGTGISDVTEKLALADYAFDTDESSFIIPPGFWGISFSSITSSSLQRYFDSTGASIAVVLDGGFVTGKVIVKDGSDYSVDLDALSGTVIYFGYVYTGIIETLPINMGGVFGTAFSKLKNIDNVRVGFIDSINTQYGVDPYSLNEFDFRKGDDLTDRPPPLFTGIKDLPNVNGGWGNKKSLFFVQNIPVSNTITSIDIAGDTEDV